MNGVDGDDVDEAGCSRSQSSPRVVAGFADGIVGSRGTVAGDEREAVGVGQRKSCLVSALWAMVSVVTFGRIGARWGPSEVVQRREAGIC